MIKLVLPTHYYEKIIEKLGGNPAELPDRCECTMVDQIVNLIDNGIEGGGGGGGGFVVNVFLQDNEYAADKTYAEIVEAAKKQPVIAIEQFVNDEGQAGCNQYALMGCFNDCAIFAAPYLEVEMGENNHYTTGTFAGFSYCYINANGFVSVNSTD